MCEEGRGLNRAEYCSYDVLLAYYSVYRHFLVQAIAGGRRAWLYFGSGGLEIELFQRGKAVCLLVVDVEDVFGLD